MLDEFEDEENDQLPELVLRWLSKHEDRPVRAEEFVDAHRLQDEKLLETFREMTSRQQFAVLYGKKNSYYWTFEAEDEKWQEVLHALNDFHGQHPFLPGAPRLYLKNRCFATWDAPRVDAYLDFLVCEGRIGRGSPCGAAKRRSGCFMSGRSPKKSDLFRQKRNDDHKISEEEQ